MSDRIQDALRFIPSDDREIWIMVGMAIKSELGESGFDIWDGWSQSAASYSAKAARASWRSFRGQGVTIASLYHEAMAQGWKPRDGHIVEPLTAQQQREREQARAARQAREEMERDQEQAEAARKAQWILAQCKHERHAYLHSKGWPDATGAVWWPAQDSNLLCIPMRVGSQIVGIQMIDRRGEKKYLKGARTSEAEFVFSNDGYGAVDWWVEGYATGMSLRECLNALRMRYRIHVCFSSGNLKKMAVGGLVVADVEASGAGVRAAEATGLPYFTTELGDFNDLHKKVGTFRASQELRRWLSAIKREAAMAL